jgi:hypothetical protein
MHMACGFMLILVTDVGRRQHGMPEHALDLAADRHRLQDGAE